MHGVFGNSMRHQGYSCLMPALVKTWRALWSGAGAGTTDPQAPFGLLTLAPSGTEGGNDIGTMRWAQTAGYGVLPNAAMPNTFLAQAFDLNDPFSNITCYHAGCCPNNYHPKPGKCGGCDKYCNSLSGTNYYMGPIHPRDKKPVGSRLARAAAVQVYGKSGAGTGPTLAGCEADSSKITLKFNKVLLAGDSVEVQTYNKLANMSKLAVLVNQSAFCMQTTGRGGSTCIDDGGGNSGAVGDFGSSKNWVHVDLAANADGTVTVDLAKSNGVAFAIRYGWAGDCCSERPPTSDPCPIASCPLMGKTSGLPANPFIAKIVGGKCKCLPPQTCDE